MKIAYQKRITKKTFEKEIISEWFQPKGFDLAIVALSTDALQININLVFGSFEEFKRLCLIQFDHAIEHDSALAFACNFKDKEGKNWNFLNIQRNDWTAEDYGTIAHELHHITHFSLDEKGIAYGSAGEECFAYVQGYFMELVVRAFQELRKTPWYVSRSRKIKNNKSKK